MVSRHRLLLDLIFWWRSSHVIVIIVIQVASAGEVGRPFMLMCTSIILKSSDCLIDIPR